VLDTNPKPSKATLDDDKRSRTGVEVEVEETIPSPKD